MFSTSAFSSPEESSSFQPPERRAKKKAAAEEALRGSQDLWALLDVFFFTFVRPLEL